MIYDKKSIDYQINLEALREMEICVPMTSPEIKALRKWVKGGHDVDSNPWNLYDCDGFQMNFIEAYRIMRGYSRGPWDYWKGSLDQTYWDKEHKSFVPDEYIR